MAKFKTPQELLEAYSNGLLGAFCDEEHLAKFLAKLPNATFTSAARDLAGSGKGRLSLPFKSVIKLSRIVPPYKEKQTTGDCVSHGTRNAVDLSRAVQIDVGGTNEDFVTVGATEAIYGSRGSGGVGMVCSMAAEFVHRTGGIVLRKNYPGVQDFTKYNGDLAAGWGSRGLPNAVRELAKQHQVKTVTQVRTVESARDALANGYGLAVCSGYGFSARRDSKGFARTEGSWGHCFKADTWISGPQNNNIQDVKVGDLVYDHNGDIQKVYKIIKRDFSGNTITIKPRNLPKFSMTSEHPTLVARIISNKIVIPAANSDTIVKLRTKTRELMWIKAQDIQKTDYLVCPHINYQDTKIIPIFEKSSNRAKPLQFIGATDNMAWLLGLFIADGHVELGHKIKITLALHEMDYAERIKKIVKEELSLDTKIAVKKNCLRVIIYSATLANNFKRWFYSENGEKKIPDFLLTWNRKEIINGIFAGDGCVARNAKRINNISKDIIYNIWHILISIGEYPSIHKTKATKKTFKNGKQGYAIQWVENTNKHKGFNEFGYYYLPISNIEVEYFVGEVYNLEIENSHSYIANGLATHNCMAWTACDDTGSEPAFLVQNSWGKWNDGGHPEWGPIPDGSFLIHVDDAEGMLRGGGAFAFSAVDGFPAVDLPDYGSSEYI